MHACVQSWTHVSKTTVIRTLIIQHKPTTFTRGSSTVYLRGHASTILGEITHGQINVSSSPLHRQSEIIHVPSLSILILVTVPGPSIFFSSFLFLDSPFGSLFVFYPFLSLLEFQLFEFLFLFLDFHLDLYSFSCSCAIQLNICLCSIHLDITALPIHDWNFVLCQSI